MPLSLEAERARQRQRHADLNEIGELPPIKNKRRRAACKKSLLKFLTTYCMGPGGLLKTPPSPKMAEIIAHLQETVIHGGRTHVRMPRGHGKSSYVKAACLYALVYGYRKFVVAVAARSSDAKSMIEDIYNIIDGHEKFGEDFPEVAVPIRELEGIHQRARQQTHNGVRTRSEKTAERIILPTVEGSKASGAILVARGFKGAARGLVRGSIRPDLLILDDLQTEAVARNPATVAAYVESVEKGLLALGGHDKQIAAFQTSTPICPDDLSETFAQKSTWSTYTFPMLISEPLCWRAQTGDLWAEYFRIRQDSIAAGEPEHEKCNAFYLAHRAAMDEGAEVLNPDFYDRATESSGLEHAMALRFSVGEEAFQSEFQMRPKRRRDTFSISAPLVASRVRPGVPEFFVPPESVFVCAATDLNPAYGFSSAIVAFDKSQTGFVPWYEVFRQPPIPIADEIPDKLRNQLLTQALVAQGKQLATICRTHGIALARWGVDCGGKQWDAVNNFARVARQTCGVSCLPMAGRAGRNWSPRVKSAIADARNETVLCADMGKGWKWLAFNADYWRETMQRAWLGEPGTPGSLSLYEGGGHGEFAAQVAGEILEYKVQLSDGRTDYRWRQVGSKHDYGDSVTMTYALAGAFGISAAGYQPPPRKAKGVRVAARPRKFRSRYVK